MYLIVFNRLLEKKNLRMMRLPDWEKLKSAIGRLRGGVSRHSGGPNEDPPWTQRGLD